LCCPPFAALAAWRPRVDVIVTAMAGLLAFSLPHAADHLAHPAEALTASVDVVNAASRWIAVVLASAVRFVTIRVPAVGSDSTPEKGQ